MNALHRLVNAEFIYALGWTILHSFWQCTIVAAVLIIALRFTKKLSSNIRYLIACSALVLCFVLSLVTFKGYWDVAQQARLSSMLDFFGIALNQPVNVQSVVQHWLVAMDAYLIWIVAVWAVGCGVMSARGLLDFMWCLKLKKESAELASPHWDHILNQLCQKVGIACKVTIRVSLDLHSPCTIGHFKPLIFLPIGLLAGMSQAQVEIILLHELGHIRRNDYAIGLVQMLLKILFFFNPMALWISSVIDAERENACDDISVDICKDALFFSKTLKEFADMNKTPNLSMAMSNNKMHLLARIQRQLQGRSNISRALEKLVAGFVLLFCCAAASVYAQTNSPVQTVDLQQKIEAELIKWPVFSRLPEAQRLSAVKHFLEEYDERHFSEGVTGTQSLAQSKYPTEKLDVSFYQDPLKVKIDISRELLGTMSKKGVSFLEEGAVALLKDDKDNYLIVIDNKKGIAKKNIGDEEKQKILLNSYRKASLNNKFFSNNNLKGYQESFKTSSADLTFKVSYQYLFIIISPILVDYALTEQPQQTNLLAYGKHSLVPGAPYAGAQKGDNGNMIITYDRTAWEAKADWMRNNSLYENSPANVKKDPSEFEMEKEIADSLAKLDARRKQLLLTDVQFKKLQACFERYFGFSMPKMFSYNMKTSMISSLIQAGEEDLVKMEASKSERLKNFVMGAEGNRFSVNLLDDSTQTPEDPEGLASCDK